MRYQRQLAAFARVAVPAGGTAPVTVTVRQADLGRWDVDAGAYVVDAGVYTLFVGDCLDGGFSGPNHTPWCAAPMQSVSLTLTAAA